MSNALVNEKKYPFVLQLGILSSVICVFGLQFMILFCLTTEEQDYWSLRTCTIGTIIMLIVLCALFLSSVRLGMQTRKKAYMDEIGIQNKRASQEHLQRLEAGESTYHVGVIMFDLNNLKMINDSLGHLAGDEIISGFAHILGSLIYPNCNIYRIGGDEFMIIAEHTEAKKLEMIIDTVESRVMEYNTKHHIPIAYAVGYAVSTEEDYRVMDELIQIADAHMYENKKWKKQMRTA